MSTHNIKTSCGSCIFRQCEIDGMQFGCELGRLQIFQDKGQIASGPGDYIGETDECELSTYTIDRFCNTCRNTSWQEKIVQPYDYKAGESFTDIARKEVQVDVDVIILVGESMEDLNKTLLSVKEQKLLPKSVVLVNKKPATFFLANTMLRITLENTGIKYVNTMKVAGEDNEWEALNVGVEKCNSSYYAVFESGTEIPANYISEFDSVINDELEQVSMIAPAEGLDGLLVQTLIHKTLKGSDYCPEENKDTYKYMTIVDKIRAIAKDIGQEAMIWATSNTFQ